MITDTDRLEFLMENRIRIEKWHTNPATEFYYVMNEDGESVARELTGREAIDAAMAEYGYPI